MVYPEIFKVKNNEKFYKIYEGTAQRGVISHTLANIYLHHVLDIWFNNFIKRKCKGEAKAFYETLKNRLNKLQVAEDKTKVLYFGKIRYYDGKFKRASKLKSYKDKTFDFLEFTHYCSCRRNRSFKVKRKISSKKFRASVMKVGEVRNEAIIGQTLIEYLTTLIYIKLKYMLTYLN